MLDYIWEGSFVMQLHDFEAFDVKLLQLLEPESLTLFPPEPVRCWRTCPSPRRPGLREIPERNGGLNWGKRQ